MEALNRVLKKTLKFIKKKFKDDNIFPSVLWTGNGYHIYLPVAALILELESIFDNSSSTNQYWYLVIHFEKLFLHIEKNMSACHASAALDVIYVLIRLNIF